MNIKTEREKLGLTKRAFAIKCGISLNTLDKWELGLSTPNPENMTRIKEVLKGGE